MRRNSGLRTIFIMFWTVGSVFWVLIGALDGNFKQSVITIAIGWAIIFIYLSLRDAYIRKQEAEETASGGDE